MWSQRQGQGSRSGLGLRVRTGAGARLEHPGWLEASPGPDRALPQRTSFLHTCCTLSAPMDIAVITREHGQALYCPLSSRWRRATSRSCSLSLSLGLTLSLSLSLSLSLTLTKQVEAGDESLVLRCATLAEREAWVGAIQTDPNSLALTLTTNPDPDHSP